MIRTTWSTMALTSDWGKGAGLCNLEKFHINHDALPRYNAATDLRAPV
jgi:hypothetical protein